VENPNTGAEPYDDLEAWAREHFEIGEAQYRWTRQNCSPVGVTGASIRDLITQEQVTEEYRGIFDTRRKLANPDSTLISARTT